MKPIAILCDSLISPLPSFTAQDVCRALSDADIPWRLIDQSGLAELTREENDVLVLPYLDGDLSGSPMEGMLRFHRQGGGLVFLGDTPHVGRSYPPRNSQAPDLRMTHCRDTLSITGLTPKGLEILGDLPDWSSMLGKPMVGVRTSAFAPDECHDLLLCEAGFKHLSPIVLIDRKHPEFLGAKVVVAGFEGGEPRENILGVCERPWTFNPGLLDRSWAGADLLVVRLILAALPPEIALAIDLDPVLPEGNVSNVSLRIRNLGSVRRKLDVSCLANGSLLSEEMACVLEPHETSLVFTHEPLVAGGPTSFQAVASEAHETWTVERSRFGVISAQDCPDLAIGFSVFRVFRSPCVDEAYRDFFRSTAAMGMQYARLALAWEDLEPEPGRYDWTVPDQLLRLSDEYGIPVFFWVFPTARGSGLSEGGVPEWTLREPSIDRFGKAGNFPCIWSPFYRTHYYSFLEALASRYANDDRLKRLVFDFGNSDFPYTYHFYGDRGDLFDYSPHEQQAFAKWLESRRFPLDDLNQRWERNFSSYSEIPIPLSEQKLAWLLYQEFRIWGVHQGIKDAVAIIHQKAPTKAPPDFPGHGTGSIADLSTYVLHAHAKNWLEQEKLSPELTEAHNTGYQWGGEPWQVGGRYPDYDDALFQSIRLEANYITIPGPDLGVWENDISRIAMIRRSLAGAKRQKPRVAVLDKLSWNDWGSLAHVGSRLDQPVDIISMTCRYDFTCYDVLVLPPDEVISTARGIASLLPLDEGFYTSIHQAVRRGLKVVVYPRTGMGDPLNPLRRLWGLEDISYGPRASMRVEFPPTWQGGTAEGKCCSVQCRKDDAVLLKNEANEPVAIFRQEGAGGFLLVGFDSSEDSFDGAIRHDSEPYLGCHTLARLLGHLEVTETHLHTGQINCYKEFLTRGDDEFLIFFSHQQRELLMSCEFQSQKNVVNLLELASGKTVPVFKTERQGWFRFEFSLPKEKGFYFVVR